MSTAREMKLAGLLREVREKVRNDVDARVIRHLDEAIDLLEAKASDGDGDEQRAKAALRSIGRALRWIPAIKILLEELM